MNNMLSPEHTLATQDMVTTTMRKILQRKLQLNIRTKAKIIIHFLWNPQRPKTGIGLFGCGLGARSGPKQVCLGAGWQPAAAQNRAQNRFVWVRAARPQRPKTGSLGCGLAARSDPKQVCLGAGWQPAAAQKQVRLGAGW